jgi:fructokinase
MSVQARRRNSGDNNGGSRGCVIAVAGEALIDAHLDGDLLRMFAGGGPFNTAVALGRLGTPVRFVGALSRDSLGTFLELKLRSAGVDTSCVARVDAVTPIAIVDNQRADPHYSFYLSGTAHEVLREHDLAPLPPGVAAVHVGTLALATNPPGDTVAAFAEHEARNRTLILDPNVRPATIGGRDSFMLRLERVAAVADLVKLSSADLAWLYPGRNSAEVAGRLLSAGAGCVVVTDGAAGAAGWTDFISASAAAPTVTVVDTVGAGDAFGAGLITWLWRNERLDKTSIRRISAADLGAALAYAAAAGAAQCTRASAWGPTTADVDQLLGQQRRA